MSSVSRRDFLAAGAAATTAKAYTRIVGANERIRIGVIGCGGMATGHMRALVKMREAENFEIAAVSDLFDKRLEAASTLTGGKQFKEYKKLLENKDIDYVLNATPEHWHAQVILDTLSAGKHMYSEKPMTYNIEEAKKVVAKVKATGLKLQVGVQGMSDESYEVANQYVKDGYLGKVVLAQIDYSRNHKDDFWVYKEDPDAKPGVNLDWNTWQGNTRKRPFDAERFFSWRRFWDYSGGIASDLFVHRVTRIIKSLGLTFPERVVATGGKFQFPESKADIPDTFNMLLDYPEGVTVQLVSSMANDTAVSHLLRGHKATLEFTKTGFTITPQSLYAKDVKPVTYEKKGAEDVSLHHKNLQAAIRRNEPLKCDCMLGYYGVVAARMGVESFRRRKYLAWDKAKERVIHDKLLLAYVLAAAAMAQTYDVLLKGGHVIDPRNNVDAVRDVAILNGKIAAVSQDIAASQAKEVLDVRGLYVTPGLVDIHVHLFFTTGVKDAWAGDNSVMPDSYSFRTGTTTMVDAGSSGWRNFETFRHTVIDRFKTRVFAFINISGLGMTTNIVEQPVSDMRPEEVAKLARKHKDVVVGVKSAHYEAADWTSVERALEAGRLANIPIMVDFGWFLKERPYWQLVTEKLRPGDISTHFFRGPVPIADENGKIYEYLKQARARGVKFDVGHGGGSFVWRNAVPAITQGFYPDSISTDLHSTSMNGPMFDMPITMSKMLILGMPLKDVILRSTWNPAQEIHHPELGHLSVGAVADVAAFRVLEGEFGYGDQVGGRVIGKQRLQCELTLREGKIVYDWNVLGGVDWKTLPKDYGVRKGEFIVTPPKARR